MNAIPKTCYGCKAAIPPDTPHDFRRTETNVGPGVWCEIVFKKDDFLLPLCPECQTYLRRMMLSVTQQWRMQYKGEAIQ